MLKVKVKMDQIYFTFFKYLFELHFMIETLNLPY